MTSEGQHGHAGSAPRDDHRARVDLGGVDVDDDESRPGRNLSHRGVVRVGHARLQTQPHCGGRDPRLEHQVRHDDQHDLAHADHGIAAGLSRLYAELHMDRRDTTMQDAEVLKHIEALVAEEHALLDDTDGDDPAHDKHKRLREVQVSLDQCWDLLRRRRARRHAGEDPDAARTRDANTVEHYKQ